MNVPLLHCKRNFVILTNFVPVTNCYFNQLFFELTNVLLTQQNKKKLTMNEDKITSTNLLLEQKLLLNSIIYCHRLTEGITILHKVTTCDETPLIDY